MGKERWCAPTEVDVALCWVKAGECGQETSIEARKVDPVKIAFEITTTCEHIQALADELGK